MNLNLCVLAYSPPSDSQELISSLFQGISFGGHIPKFWRLPEGFDPTWHAGHFEIWYEPQPPQLALVLRDPENGETGLLGVSRLLRVSKVAETYDVPTLIDRVIKKLGGRKVYIDPVSGKEVPFSSVVRMEERVIDVPEFTS